MKKLMARAEGGESRAIHTSGLVGCKGDRRQRSEELCEGSILARNNQGRGRVETVRLARCSKYGAMDVVCLQEALDE